MVKNTTKDPGEKGGSGPAGKRKDRSPLKNTTVRLHPDVLKAIERKAAAERRNPADVFRDIIAKGLAAEGIYL